MYERHADQEEKAMKRGLLVAVTVLAVMAAGGRNAGAADAGTGGGFATRLFAGDIGKQAKSYACFVRQYDAAHLAEHPLQKVNGMKLLVTAEQTPEDAALDYSFRLGIRFRDRPGNFDSSGDCGHVALSETADHKEHLGCSVDCDGGGITVELTADAKSTLIRLAAIRIWKDNKPDDKVAELSGGADDRVFRLDRAGIDECASLANDRKELAAMRRKTTN
jgi:hypothetical protein